MVIDYAKSIGFSILRLDYSPIKGPEGNIEYLLHIKNDDKSEGEVSHEEVVQIVQNAHGEL